MSTDTVRQARQTMVAVIRCVWSAIDWDDSLWSDRRAVWDRFAGRVRVAASAHDIGAFIAALSRKCHVAMPKLDLDVVDMINVADEAECMRQVRTNAPLIVGLLRAEREREKAVAAARKKPEPGLFTALEDSDE